MLIRFLQAWEYFTLINITGFSTLKFSVFSPYLGAFGISVLLTEQLKHLGFLA